MMKTLLASAIAITLASAPAVLADSPQAAKITQVQGEVKIFSHPGKTVQGPPPHALFEGEYFSVHDAKAGEPVEQGNIVRTAVGARARIVYENGDQFNIGSGTAYRVNWKDDQSPEVTLKYGKLRGIVAKGGPRSRLIIRTQAATMGVRGTDFFIAEGGGTEVTILRGEVEVKAADFPAKLLVVKAGESAEIPPLLPPTDPKETVADAKAAAKKPKPDAPKAEVRKTTKEDLAGIQKSSFIQTEIKTEIAPLEKKAAEMTLNDIKLYDPQLFAKIQPEAMKSSSQINNLAVENLVKDAPKAPSKRKPYRSELEDLEKGAYEKYFKIED